MIEFISIFTGIFWKLYDDYADNKDAYSFLKNIELPLEIVMMALSIFFAFFDNMFLMYLMIIIFSDCALHIFKMNNENIKVNYAIDTDVWKCGALIAYVLCLFRVHSIVNTFTLVDYGIISLAITFIIIEIASQCTDKKEILDSEKENHLYLEASNKKLTTRIIELVLFSLFFYVVLIQYNIGERFTNVIFFAISYISVSIVSILYLKYFYFYKEGLSLFEK